jgi:hypothetical protein
VHGIIMNVKAKFAPYRKIFEKRNYVEHKLDLKAPAAIAEILVGPLAAPGIEDEVREFLRVQDYPPSIPVLRSTSTI